MIDKILKFLSVLCCKILAIHPHSGPLGRIRPKGNSFIILPRFGLGRLTGSEGVRHLTLRFLPSTEFPLRKRYSTSPSSISLALEGSPFRLRSNTWTRASTRFTFPYPLGVSPVGRGEAEARLVAGLLRCLPFLFLILSLFIEESEGFKGFQARVDIANRDVATKIVALRITVCASGSIILE